jgi:hypothetical protein
VLGIWGPQGTRVLAAEQQWKEPVKWQKVLWERFMEDGSEWRARVFCASLADVFEEWHGQMSDAQERPLWYNDEVGDALTHPMKHLNNTGQPFTLDLARARLWELIRQTPNLDWQLLTKRPENVPRMMPPGPWPNVWIGASVEDNNQRWRIDALQEARHHLQCPVAFLSAEPLLGPLDLSLGLGKDAVNWVIVGGRAGARPGRARWSGFRRSSSSAGPATLPCSSSSSGPTRWT